MTCLEAVRSITSSIEMTSKPVRNRLARKTILMAEDDEYFITYLYYPAVLIGCHQKNGMSEISKKPLDMAGELAGRQAIVESKTLANWTLSYPDYDTLSHPSS
ncbi:unnamed protein product [Angiostrongylus costaricensis]|uniref:Transposase n=1 Tax=Angiostrongylus costaricensis TaxID=334426 RepID=A0A0R3PSR0_ANGCS|nr:unnamed protein product [Angiostrongylus costaricensis]